MLVLHKNISENKIAWELLRNEIRAEQGLPSAHAIPTSHLMRLAEWKRSGKTIGVCAMYKNDELKEGLYFLAGFESVLNENSAVEFLQEVTSYLKGMGGKKVIGPMPGSTWEEYGFQTQGAKALFYEEIFSVEYVDYWNKAGFSSDKDFFHFQLNQMPNIDIQPQWTAINEAGIYFNYKDKFDPKQLVKKMYHFLHKSFQKAYLFSPLDWKAFQEKFLPLCQPQHDSLLWVGTCKEEIVALAFGMKSSKSPSSYILKTLARDPDLPLKGVGYLLGLHFIKDCQRRGAEKMIFANMREDNFSLFRAQGLGAEKIITKTLFQKQLS